MTAHSSIYDSPDLYDLAFSYRDCAAEARFLRSLYQSRRGRDATSFLELAAGPARHSVEMLEAGLRVVALDLSPRMASYGRFKAAARGLALEYAVGDMTCFEVPRAHDLVACLLCSASYLLTPEAFVSHLVRVRAALAPGGIYVLELTHPLELTSTRKSSSTWKMRDDGGELEITWGGDPSRAIGGVWQADVWLRYVPFDGSPPIEINEQAPQRGYTLQELEHFAEHAGLAIEATFGAFDERVALDDREAQRMILALTSV